ncbi:hypothetical protein TWF225_009889 [Orbilia oligospora]|uniref:Uncharacterized protein n=1 Tax=Orbilia oligospora TaxID=2813651 RepID=A0A7C8K7S4_ORBOL|nr:hypothetical protein TWF751_008787 [Orbilia oligospora]KAF3173110.1 hypothetical protein TWF225_009889 [Orbilia oligospora]KAF3267510.1 hypothetical protein TWF128_009055 [Orbilia oligospora]KAF3267511.1 hypothetical protein TWF128_009055 [Orbilia oligospora]KAF3269264.1 hypothetical protein TWF217_009355 [Orbilia oligospora]
MTTILSLPTELLFQIVEYLQQDSTVASRRPHSKIYYLSYGPHASCLLPVAHSCSRLRHVSYPLLHRRLELSHSASCLSLHSSSMSCDSILLAYVPLISYLNEYPQLGYVTRELKVGPWSSSSYWKRLRGYMCDENLDLQMNACREVARKYGIAYPVLLSGINSGDSGVFVTLLTYLLPNLTELSLTLGDEARPGVPSTRHLIVAWKTIAPPCYQHLSTVNLQYGDVESHGEYPCSTTVAEILQLPALRKFTVHKQWHDPRGISFGTNPNQLSTDSPNIPISFSVPQIGSSINTSNSSAKSLAFRSNRYDEEIRLNYRNCSEEDLLEISCRSASELERVEFNGSWMGQWNVLPIIRSAAHLKVLKLTDSSFVDHEAIVEDAIASHAATLETLILDIGCSFTEGIPSFLPYIAKVPNLKILWLNFKSILSVDEQPIDLEAYLPPSLRNLVVKDTNRTRGGQTNRLQAYQCAIQSLSSITSGRMPNLTTVHVWKPTSGAFGFAPSLFPKLEELQEYYISQGIELLLM